LLSAAAVVAAGLAVEKVLLALLILILLSPSLMVVVFTFPFLPVLIFTDFPSDILMVEFLLSNLEVFPSESVTLFPSTVVVLPSGEVMVTLSPLLLTDHPSLVL